MTEAREIYDQVGIIEEFILEELTTDQAIVWSLPPEIQKKVAIIRKRTPEEFANIKKQRKIEEEAERAEKEKAEKEKDDKDRLIKAERERLKEVYAGQGKRAELENYLRSMPPIYGKLGKDRIEEFIKDNQKKTPGGKILPLENFRQNTLNLYKEALDLPLRKIPLKRPQEEDAGPSQTKPQPGPSQSIPQQEEEDFTQGVLEALYDKEREKIPDVLQAGPSKTKSPESPPKQPESQAGPSKTKPESQAGPSQPKSESTKALKELSEMAELKDDVERRRKFTEIIQQLYDDKEANPKLNPDNIDKEVVQTEYYRMAMGLHELIMEGKNKASKGFAEFMLKYVFEYIYEGFFVQYEKALTRANREDMERLNLYMNQFEKVEKEIKTKYKITEQEPVKMSEESPLQRALNELSTDGLFGDTDAEQSLNEAIAYYITKLYNAKNKGTEIPKIDDFNTQRDIMDVASFLSQKIRAKPILSEDFAKIVIENFFEYLRDVVFEDLKSNYTLSRESTAADRIGKYQGELTREIKNIKDEFAERKKKKSGRGFKKDQIDKLIMSIIDVLEGQQQINMDIFSQDELLLFKSILETGMTQKEQDKVESILKSLKGKIGGLFDKQYPHKQTKPYYLKR
jgi:hypothetical protein